MTDDEIRELLEMEAKDKSWAEAIQYERSVMDSFRPLAEEVLRLREELAAMKAEFGEAGANS